MSAKQANNRGSMLVLVLFLAGLLSVFAAVAAMAMRAAQNSSRGFADGLRAEEAARGAIEVAVAQAGGAIARMGGTLITNFGQVQVSVVARNEAGRIDLNMAPPQLLAGLFRRLGVGAEDANLYAARIVDWRDEDDKVEKNGGAERAAYRSLGRVDGPRNGPFVHVAELGLVLGIPVQVVAAAAPYFTVASGLEQINPMFADPPVLLAIPGVSPDRVRNFLVERAKPGTKPQILIASLGKTVEEFVTEESGKAVRFEAQVRLAPNNERRFEAVVYVVEGDSEPFRILAWDANPPERLRAVP
jgi:general secretion pathway protein K